VDEDLKNLVGKTETGGTTDGAIAGVYCARCGRKMYKDSNGRWRCPWCDDHVDTLKTWSTSGSGADGQLHLH